MLSLLAVLAGVVVLTGSASATTLSYNSWSYSGGTLSGQSVDPNEYPLNEFYMSAWGIGGINLNGQHITSATITINNIANWAGSTDELFIHLLDTATNLNAVTQLEDNTSGVEPTSFTDYFLPGNYPVTTGSYPYNVPYNMVGSTVNNLIPNANVNNIALNDGSYSYAKNTIGSITGPGLPANFSVSNMTFNQGNSTDSACTNGNPTGVLDCDVGGTFTYTFSSADLTALAADIANGSDVALGFNPDCHLWNDGITFTINTAPSGSGVPEPATLSLLAMGLAGLLRKRLRPRRFRYPVRHWLG